MIGFFGNIPETISWGEICNDALEIISTRNSLKFLRVGPPALPSPHPLLSNMLTYQTTIISQHQITLIAHSNISIITCRLFLCKCRGRSLSLRTTGRSSLFSSFVSWLNPKPFHSQSPQDRITNGNASKCHLNQEPSRTCHLAVVLYPCIVSWLELRLFTNSGSSFLMASYDRFEVASSLEIIVSELQILLDAWQPWFS